MEDNFESRFRTIRKLTTTARQVLSCANDDFGYRDFASFSQRTAQEHTRFLPSAPNLEIVCLVEEERIDVVNFSEVDDTSAV